MSKASDITDPEAGDDKPRGVDKLGAILCPTVCAVLIVCVFVVSFVAAKLMYERYDTTCASRRFGVRYI